MRLTTFKLAFCGLAISLFPLVGCESGGDAETSVQEAGSIEAYLAEHPEEAYSSDGVADEADAAEDSSGDEPAAQ